ncbi:MAG: hypothetical protein RR490_10405, partial [Niameybacter sp.]
KVVKQPFAVVKIETFNKIMEVTGCTEDYLKNVKYPAQLDITMNGNVSPAYIAPIDLLRGKIEKFGWQQLELVNEIANLTSTYSFEDIQHVIGYIKTLPSYENQQAFCFSELVIEEMLRRMAREVAHTKQEHTTKLLELHKEFMSGKLDGDGEEDSTAKQNYDKVKEETFSMIKQYLISSLNKNIEQAMDHVLDSYK